VARSTPSRIGTHSMWQVTCGEPALYACARRASVKTEPTTANERATASVRAHVLTVILGFMVFPPEKNPALLIIRLFFGRAFV
jgi:hypothetical protein